MSETVINVPGRFNPIEYGTPLANASDIYDENNEKSVQETLDDENDKIALQDTKIGILNTAGTLVETSDGSLSVHYKIGDIFYKIQYSKGNEIKHYYVAKVDGFAGDNINDTNKFTDAGTSSVNALNIKTSIIKNALQGDDAYGVYVKQWKEDNPNLEPTTENGFLKQTEWLESLVGDSAYEVAVKNGYSGSESQWLEYIRGKSAREIYNSVHGTTYDDAHFIEAIKANYPMKYVEYDEDNYSATGITTISSITASEATEGKLWFMPNSDNTETKLFISVNDGTVESPDYKWYNMGVVDVPSNALTKEMVDNECTNGTVDTPASANFAMGLAKKLQGVTFEEMKATGFTDYMADGENTGYYEIDGTWKTSSSYKSTRIEVHGYDSVRFLGYAYKSSTICYCFQDEEENVISGTLKEYKDSTLASSVVVQREYIINVPEDAYYFVCLYKYSTNSILQPSNFYCYLQNGDTVIDKINKAVNSDKKLMKVVISSNEFYVRTRFSDSEDIIILFKERILAGTAKGSQSLTLDSYYIGNNKWSDEAIMATTSSCGNPPDDSTAPMYFIGFGPMTGQHGWSIPAVNRTGLAITEEDLNSIWCDANDTDRTFVLGYMTSTHLFFFPVVTNDNGIYGTTAGTIFSNLPAAFNHVEGATHTDTINKQSIRYDLRVESSKWSYLVDNYVVKEGTYYCDDFTFIESVTGYNPSNVDYSDWFINPSDNTKYNDDIFILISRAFVFKGNSFAYNLTLNPVYPFKVGVFRLVQPMLPIATTENNITYHANIFVPKAKGITTPYINDDGIGSSNSKYRKTSDLYDINDLPDRAVCFLKSDNNEYKLGMAGGFSLTHGMTTKNVRNTLVKNEERVCYFGNGSSSKNKFYPSLLSSGDFEDSIIPTSFVGQMNGYICWFNPNDNPGLQVYTYKDIDGYVVYIHGQETFDKREINLPNYLEGLIVDFVIEKTGGASLLTSQVINGKLYIKFEQNDATNYSVNDNYIVLKVCKNDNDEFTIDDTHLENPTDSSLAKAEDIKEKIIDVRAFEATDFNYEGSEELLQDVASYIVDKNGVLFALLKTDGSFVPLVKNADQKRIDDLLDMVTSESPYSDDNVLKYLTDENNICFGKILKDGTVFIEKAYVGSLETKEGIQDTVKEKTLSAIIGILSVGADNIELSNNPRLWNILSNISTSNVVKLNTQNENNINFRPCLSIIDDDTIDDQIPISSGHTTVQSENGGGYFSLLLPLMLSISAKRNIPIIPVGLAAEGHRIGLTTFAQYTTDTYELNTNGLALKYLSENLGWDILSHGMTGLLSYVDPRTIAWGVDDFTPELKSAILSDSNTMYYSHTAQTTTCVYERNTGKWYHVTGNSSTHEATGWRERTTGIDVNKYSRINYKDWSTKEWCINRNYNFDYNWGEWFRRAELLGLPFRRMIVHNGETTSPFTIAAGRKYAYCSFHQSGSLNNHPIRAAIERLDGDTSGFSGDGNIKNNSWLEARKNNINSCIANKSWMVLMTHFNTSYFENYYKDGKTYEGKQENYNEEWYVPLEKAEIEAMINGTASTNYIFTPPERLGIESWSEWYPAPGTHLEALAELIEYALDNGVEIVSPWNGWKIHGNVLQLGVDSNGQSYNHTYNQTIEPFTSEEKSFLTIGADMSIRYYNANID